MTEDRMPPAHPRFLSEAVCRDIAQRLARAAQGGGYTAATIWSSWSGHVRWARNQISTSGEVRNTYIHVNRDLRGAGHGDVFLNETSDAALVAAARRAERLARLESEAPQWDLVSWFPPEPMPTPPGSSLFSDVTYELDAAHRAAAAIALTQGAAAAGVLSAGYIEVAAHSLAMLDSLGHVRYVPYTTASYSVTVRDPTGAGSGWAGADWPDWSKIDAPALSQLALEKCLASRHPVALEPARYTTILEPQAVCDLVGQLLFGVYSDTLRKDCNVGTCGDSRSYPFFKSQARSDDPGLSQLGEQVVDERITISADPLDPELGFPPFFPCAVPFGQECWIGDWRGQDVYHPTTWIKDGVLTALEYHRDSFLGDNDGLQHGRGVPNAGGFRMSGGTTTIAEMIATTKRGLLVTRLDRLENLDQKSLLLRGYTRDGLWLIEGGKISKPIKNFMFVESILFALNNIEALGVPQRAYHPATGRLAIPQPVIVPALKIKDFSFTALVDAV